VVTSTGAVPGPDTDLELDLQAIAWTHEAAARIAVVNGQVLHEGDTVSGARVVRIDPQAVVFGQAGRTWEIPFASRPPQQAE
jgi:hypothetical protein